MSENDQDKSTTANTVGKVFPVLRSHTIGGDTPEATNNYEGTIDGFGFPSTMKSMHRSLMKVINKIPHKDMEGEPARDMFLTLLSANEKDPEVIDAVCEKLARISAVQDMMDKKISQLTPADFISDKDLATPDSSAVSDLRSKLLQKDHERFAKVPVQSGKTNDEWSSLDLDSDLSPSL